nr:ribonuclease H-like domain-containing protein [Tanacetum cinerariifolium]
MKHYFEHTEYPIWEVIQKGNGLVQVSTDINGQIKVLPPKTAEEILARERETKARTTLLMAITKDHLAKFDKMTDANEMWEAIKSKFGGNDESKEMQKYLLKQQFKSFYVSNSKGLHRGYNRFQSLLSQLETHGAGVSTEDANQKFLRSLPSSCSQVSLIMRTKPGVDTLGFNDLYNNLRVFNLILKVDEFDLEEMDLKWQVAMIFTRLKKFYKKTGRKMNFEPVGFDKRKVECFNCHNTRHFARECRSKGNQGSRRRDAGNTRYKAKDNGKRSAKQDEHKAMVTIDVEEAEKEKEELKTKLEIFQSSSKGLSKLLNSQMSAKDKSRLEYGSQIHDEVLSYENEVFESVFNTRELHAPKSDFGIDELKFTYGLKQSTTSESDAKTSDLDSCDSSSTEETLETVPKLVESKPKVVNEPKVWFDAPIIEEYESDSDDEYVPKASVE